MSPGCTIRLVFSWTFSALRQHVDFVTTSFKAGFQIYLSYLALGFVKPGHGSMIQFFGSGVLFLGSLLLSG